MVSQGSVEKSYAAAKEIYADWDVDADLVLSKMDEIPFSINCWQGDDVLGFEGSQDLSGGMEVTGNYPGRARSGDELRSDLIRALSLIPGSHRVNLHAMYAETKGQDVDRNELGPEHFSRWLDWADEYDLGLDFNPTFFNHPMSADGFTLSHPDSGVRNFWIEHGKACRRIGAHFGQRLNNPCITNIWVPDGYKDMPADRLSPRGRLRESLNEILADDFDAAFNRDAVESKLFGIGSESYVVGSHDFYLAYAVERGVLLCMDAGHYHPEEYIADKITAVLHFLDEILLHLTRSVRWDSDHIVSFDENTGSILQEVARNDLFDRVHMAMDFFDATVNRIAGWVIGMRNAQKALMKALLEPADKLREMESGGDLTSRLALMEELKTYPLGAVWDYYCLSRGVPVRESWLSEVREYEKDVLVRRNK